MRSSRIISLRDLYALSQTPWAHLSNVEHPAARLASHPTYVLQPPWKEGTQECMRRIAHYSSLAKVT